MSNIQNRTLTSEELERFGAEIDALARELNVRNTDVVEMETRLAGQDVALESAADLAQTDPNREHLPEEIRDGARAATSGGGECGRRAGFSLEVERHGRYCSSDDADSSRSADDKGVGNGDGGELRRSRGLL